MCPYRGSSSPHPPWPVSGSVIHTASFLIPFPILPHTSGRAIPVTKTAKDTPGFEAEVDRVHGMVVSELQVCVWGGRGGVVFYRSSWEVVSELQDGGMGGLQSCNWSQCGRGGSARLRAPDGAARMTIYKHKAERAARLPQSDSAP